MFVTREVSFAGNRGEEIGDGRPINSRPVREQIPRSKSFVHFASEIRRCVLCTESRRNHIRTISFSRVSLHPVIYPPILFIPVASTVTFFRDSFFAKGRDRSPKGTSAGTSERSTFDRIKYGWGGRGWKIARSTLQS